MQIRLHPLVVSALIGVAVSGCLTDEPTGPYTAAGETGYFALGWAYDGQGAIPFDGTIYLEADAEANTGRAVVTGTFAGGAWSIEFDEFAEAAGKTFQDGGIAANLVEHGDSGVADTSIPRVQVDIAAWGKATVSIDGVPFNDPLTGNATWVAHYMVIRTGVRDDATRAIYADSSKTTFYDPANASMGFANSVDDEIHLVLKSAVQPPPNATAYTVPSVGPITSTMYSNTHVVKADYAGSTANLTATITATPRQATDLTFTVRDPAGEEITRWQHPTETRGPLNFIMNQTGDYTIEVTGQAVAARYQIGGMIKPPTNVLMNLWWEDIVFGPDASRLSPAPPPAGNATA